MTKDCKYTNLKIFVLRHLNSLGGQLYVWQEKMRHRPLKMRNKAYSWYNNQTENTIWKKLKAMVGIKTHNTTIPTWPNKRDNIEYR